MKKAKFTKCRYCAKNKELNLTHVATGQQIKLTSQNGFTTLYCGKGGYLTFRTEKKTLKDVLDVIDKIAILQA